jgi:cobalt/nickel transport system ATP-binding protein
MKSLFEWNDLSYRYGDGTIGLDGLSGQIGSGERVAIVGSNGSGKSTLLRILNGLIEPTSGTLSFDGKPVSEASLRNPLFEMQFRSRVGFVFQDADAQLFNATVYDEVSFGPSQLGLSADAVKKRAEETLDFLGIRHLADRAPFRLSGGEKRKVAIASVLAMNPDAILLDEPFLGLDPRSQTWLLRTLEQLHLAGKTVVIATHALDTLAKVADRALVLNEEHRLLGSFATNELLADQELLMRSGLMLMDESDLLTGAACS